MLRAGPAPPRGAGLCPERPTRRVRAVPAFGGDADLTGSSGRMGVPALAASGLPLPIQAESSCRRRPRVNTVGVCADQPLARSPAGYRAGPAIRRRPDRLVGQLGQTIAALHQLPPPGNQGLVACGLASFRGRAARGVPANRAPELASAMGGSNSTVPRRGRVVVPAAGAAAHRGHAPAFRRAGCPLVRHRAIALFGPPHARCAGSHWCHVIGAAPAARLPEHGSG